MLRKNHGITHRFWVENAMKHKLGVKTMSNELINVPQDAITALDKAAEQGLLAQHEKSRFSKAFMVAKSIEALKELLTPKNNGTYYEPAKHRVLVSRATKSIDVVRDCLIEATLKGVFPVGNNLLLQGTVITKEGFGRKLRDIDNFSWTETPGVPRVVPSGKGALITVNLEWTLSGKTRAKDLELAIKVDEYTSIDAIIGKSIRKARAWLFTAVTGQEIGDGENDGEVINPEATSPFEEEPSTAVDNSEVADIVEDDELPM